MSDAGITGPRIAVVGTCQVVGLGAALRRLVPGSKVDVWHVGVHPLETKEQTLERLCSYDLVVSQIRDGEGVLDFGRLREAVPASIFLPIVVFRGFQPDCVYLANSLGMLRGAICDMHSAIVVTAYAMGLPAERVPSLFNALVYSTLGYFDALPMARHHVVATFAAAGFEVAPCIDAWIHAQGAFMYTPNHPHICVLADLARMVAERAGLIDRGAPVPGSIEDSLAGHVQWPVYPELARRAGVAGSLTFTQARHSVAAGQPGDLSLPDFIALSYQLYRQSPMPLIRESVPAGILTKLGGVMISHSGLR